MRNRCFLILLFVLPLFTQAQRIVETDSTLRKSAYSLIQKMTDGKAVDSQSSRVIVLGNEECGHCKEMQKELEEASVIFEMYDVAKDQKFFNLIIDYYTKKSGGEGIAISYPVVVARGMMYSKIYDVMSFVASLKSMQEKGK